MKKYIWLVVGFLIGFRVRKPRRGPNRPSIKRDIVAPYTKDLLSDIVTTATERMLYGDRPVRRQGYLVSDYGRPPADQIPRTRFSNTNWMRRAQPEDHLMYGRQSMTDTVKTFNGTWIPFDDMEQGLIVLHDLNKLMQEQGYLCVNDVYERVSMNDQQTFGGNIFGWDAPFLDECIKESEGSEQPFLALPEPKNIRQ